MVALRISTLSGKSVYRTRSRREPFMPKDDGDPLALAEVLKRCQAALGQIERLRKGQIVAEGCLGTTRCAALLLSPAKTTPIKR